MKKSISELFQFEELKIKEERQKEVNAILLENKRLKDEENNKLKDQIEYLEQRQVTFITFGEIKDYFITMRLPSN